MRVRDDYSHAGGLSALGLSASQQEVYEAVVDRSVVTLADLRGLPVAVPPGQLARALRELRALGLVEQSPGRPGGYRAVSPEAGLQSLLRRREDELTQARLSVAELTQRFQQAQVSRVPAELLEIIVGERDVRSQYAVVHRMAREQLRVMSRPPYVLTDALNRAVTADAHSGAVRVRNIADTPTVEDMGAEVIRADLAAGEQYRVMGHVPLKLLIADEQAGLVMLENPPEGIQSAVLVHPCALLRSLAEVFETLWQIAAPLDVLRDGGPFPGGLDTPDRQLLALLVAGLSDRAISRRLALSPTTVRRRLHDLKQRLGAASRFQAGWQARGLIDDLDPAPDPGKAALRA